MTETPDEVWTIAEAAKFIGMGVTPRQVRRWADAGDLVAVRATDNGWRRVLASSVRAKRAEMLAEHAGSVPDGETWTVGEAAEFLGFGITARTVSRWIDAGELVGVQGKAHGWRRVLASSVQAKRRALLRQVEDDAPAVPAQVPRQRGPADAPDRAAE